MTVFAPGNASWIQCWDQCMTYLKLMAEYEVFPGLKTLFLRYGCCLDGVTPAQGFGMAGCPEYQTTVTRVVTITFVSHLILTE